ncbi:peptidase family t4 protein [Colletotrichum sojae]|uniref:Peptidase family t4 protein n=1 Tax=Colletotrichum sojae TaxID=2175907 RepID=A0A8H6IT80_9PEZI|nr:peptidase family t4 protein [Colletotrichum sojae]
MRIGDEWTFVPARDEHNHPPPFATEAPKETARAKAEALAKKRAAERGRARDILPGLDLGSWPPGAKNSLTDVPGVLVSVQSAQPNDQVNTGVTIILPRKEWLTEACHANIFRFNGAGEMTGAHWIQESGLLNSPIVLTNPLSIGDAHRGIYEWAIRHHVDDTGELESHLVPVVAETYDGYLSDIYKMPIKPQDITRGIDLCTDDPVPEGNTGGGTGTVCHHWKGGTGSSSRVVSGTDTDGDETSYTVGVLVQANYGKAQQLRIGGAPVGRILHEAQIRWQSNVAAHKNRKDGSIVVVLATDAPLSSAQCERLAKRATIGLSRVGGYGHNMSGDIFIAFSTGNSIPVAPVKLSGTGEVDPYSPKALNIETVDNSTVDGLFEAAADATEEAIYNALFMAQSMKGFKGRNVQALPLKRVKEIMEKYL